jgi:hypothetical protein
MIVSLSRPVMNTIVDDRIGSKAVAEFNSDPAQFVFLISTKAGGVG